ncbi:MAG: hypothetical protein K2L37_06675, partial [Lactobacillus sp.]|nr:hypothetical protein [Lactobacillus sp.]
GSRLCVILPRLTKLPFESKLEIKGIDTPVLCIPFGEEYDTIKKIREIVGDSMNMSILHVYDGEELVAEYKNYINLEQITTAKFEVNGNTVEVLMAKMGRENTIPEQINSLTEKIATLEKEKTELEKSYNAFQEKTADALTEAVNNTTVTKQTVDEFVEEAKVHITTLQHDNIGMQNEISNIATTASEAAEKASAAENVVNRVSESLSTFAKNANENFDKLSESSAEQSEALSNIEQSVNDLHVEIKGINEEDMTLDQLKEHRIGLSKVNLHNHLETSVVISDVHGGVDEEYSITEEKQTQLMAMIMMASMNPDYQPSWNAKGKPCSYDWTIDQLKYLAAQIEAIVRPLVSKQQHMENDIKAATNEEEVKMVDITF